jgi:hypothetical protein
VRRLPRSFLLVTVKIFPHKEPDPETDAPVIIDRPRLWSAADFVAHQVE